MIWGPLNPVPSVSDVTSRDVDYTDVRTTKHERSSCLRPFIAISYRDKNQALQVGDELARHFPCMAAMNNPWELIEKEGFKRVGDEGLEPPTSSV